MYQSAKQIKCFFKISLNQKFCHLLPPKIRRSLPFLDEGLQQPPQLIYSWPHLFQLHVPNLSSNSQSSIWSFCTILALTWQSSDILKLFSIQNEDWKGRLGGLDVITLEISNSATYQVPEILTLPSHFAKAFTLTYISKIARFHIQKPYTLKNKFLIYLNNKLLHCL